MHDLVGQQLGNYRVVRLVGRGGFADVYLGEHIHLNSLAALKVLHAVLTAEQQESFVQEAQRLVQLRHPHIVRLLDFAVQAGTPFLVMDYAPGGTLRELHPIGSRLPLDLVVSYVQQVASALHYAHSQRLIHRDIKPENMLLGSQNNLLLSDFGLAVSATLSSSYSTLLMDQQVAGTSLYLAPEQLQGHPLPASDQYSLAVVVYEWLCGKSPFHGSLLEIAIQHLSLPPPPLRDWVPDLSSSIEEVVLQALAKEPWQRFADVQEFARALERAYLEDLQQFSALHYPTSPDTTQLRSLEKEEVPSAQQQQPVRQITPGNIRMPEPIWKVPTIFTPLIGRDQEAAAVGTLLKSPEIRLVTLLGTGGIGKTRLSLQIAVQTRKYFIDGVCFVPLASISDAGLILPAIAQELGIQDASALPVFEQVKAFLQKKHILLVLDNFEQVAIAAPMVEELLAACPQLTILVTSRVVLHVQAEHEFPVSPLALPDLTLPIERDALAQVTSVALFLQRARSILPTFQLTSTNARAIAEICVRLDGLPLAIELAAARIKILPPQALLLRLEHLFDVLTGGTRTQPPRQQTLRNTLKWSYDLLSASEQRLFRRLAVFVAGWTLEAVEAVCYYDVEKEQVSALDEVASLLDKSLLLLLESEGREAWLQMLMTVREYGLERLRASGEAEQTRQAHALYYLALAEEAERQQFGGEQALWLERLEQEDKNPRAALQWLSEQHQTELSLRLSGSLYWFWTVRGHINEGHLWLEKALAESEGTTAPVYSRDDPRGRPNPPREGTSNEGTSNEGAPPIHPALPSEGISAPVLAKALKNAGGFAYYLGKYNLAEEHCQKSLALYRQLGDTQGSAFALYWLGLLACWTSHNYPLAHALAEEALALQTALNNKSGMADALLMSAYIALNQGNYPEARHFIEQGLACFKEAHDSWGMASALQYLGRVMLEQGDFALAHTKLEESGAISIELGYKNGIAFALGLKGHVALRLGDTATARSLIEESLALHREVGQQSGMAESLFLLAKVSQAEGNYAAARTLYEKCLALLEKLNEQDLQIRCLSGLGVVAMEEGRPASAVLLWSVAAQMREAQGILMPPLDRTDYEPAETSARTLLGAKTFASLWAQGYTMTPEQVLALQEQDITPTPPSSLSPPAGVKPPPPTNYPNGLTAREVEVLRLLAQGWTDHQIAERLVISPRTVNKHLTTIYSKIRVPSRSAATRYAIERKLV